METEYKCKKCDGIGVRDDVFQDCVQTWITNRLIDEYGHLDMNDEGDHEKAKDLQNQWWLDTERKVKHRFKLMYIVEEDGIRCDVCNGSGKVDWVTYIMGC